MCYLVHSRASKLFMRAVGVSKQLAGAEMIIRCVHWGFAILRILNSQNVSVALHLTYSLWSHRFLLWVFGMTFIAFQRVSTVYMYVVYSLHYHYYAIAWYVHIFYIMSFNRHRIKNPTLLLSWRFYVSVLLVCILWLGLHRHQPRVVP